MTNRLEITLEIGGSSISVSREDSFESCSISVDDSHEISTIHLNKDELKKTIDNLNEVYWMMNRSNDSITDILKK